MIKAFSILFSLSMLIGFFTIKHTKLQVNTALMLFSLSMVFFVKLLDPYVALNIQSTLQNFVNDLNFKTILLDGLLGYLLFAGAIGLDLNSLLSEAIHISLLALVSTILSTFITGIGLYYLNHIFFHVDISFITCLLFGSLISPTDPVAVLAMMRKLKAPKSLRAIIAGESLFNDGVGIVMFTVLLTIIKDGSTPTVSSVALLFIWKALGGCLFGFLIGKGVQLLITSSHNHPHLDIMLTLSSVTGGYVAAESAHVSGPLAMVVLGIMVAIPISKNQLSSGRKNTLILFWELIEELFNMILFLLIGFEIIQIHFTPTHLLYLAPIIFLTIISRFTTVALPLKFLKIVRNRKIQHSLSVISWGGLRGGLAIALALSIPDGVAGRIIILLLTYGVVIFSVVVQGNTIKWILPRNGKGASHV